MSFDFPLILLCVVVFSGVVSLVDCIYCLMNREPLFEKKKRPVIIDYARSFFPVLLAVILIRSFIAQPYRVPTGSLEPTVIPGDFIFVSQSAYGLRLPVWNKKIIATANPKRGQIALLVYPTNNKFTFVKRVIGLPGDHISYINKVLYINGKEQKQKFIENVKRINSEGQLITSEVYQEDLDGVKHDIYLQAGHTANNFYNLVVPKGEYFMMGDNRDNSDDSRYWGFVPDQNLVGRALLVWLNWNSQPSHWYDVIRWDRIGKKL